MQLRNVIYSFLVLSLVMVSLKSQAQIGDTSYNGVNDPLSFYGYGTVQYDGLQNGWMKGRTGVATTNRYSPNTINPASVSYVMLTALDFSIEGVSSTTSNSSMTAVSGGFYPSYFNLSIPVGKKGGLAFGLNQKLRTLYRIQSQEKELVNDTLMNIRRSLKGDGSLNAFKFAGAYQVIPNLSLGLTLNYNFGNQTQDQYIQFVDSTYLLGTSYYRNWVVNGFSYQIGANYRMVLSADSNKSLAIGATYTPARFLKVTEDNVDKNFLVNPNTTRADTFSSVFGREGKLGMASSFSVGLEYNLNDKLLANIDYLSMDFSNATYMEEDRNLNTYTRISMGAAFTPTRDFTKTPFSRATYSTGFYTGDDYILANGNEVKFWGVTGGLSLPLNRNLGEVRFGVEYNNRGDINQNLVNSRNTIFRFGISFSDIWFKKRYYD